MTGSDQHLIIHPGIVDHLDREMVYVRVLSQSACATCHAKGACSIAEVEDKIIEVHDHGHKPYHPGDQVTVRMKQSLGRKAVLLGYIIPLVILVVSVVTFVSVLNNEGLAALISLLLLAPYYFLLYLFRNKLKSQFTFSIYSE
jgi:sigma-E factor negative regulatory protein RseC